MPTFPSLQSSSLVEEAHRALHEAILRGDIAPGAPLFEAAVAREMGVSRGPVREALRRLEQSGLVTHEANKGYRVASFTQDDLLELAAIRLALESVAMRHAIRNPDAAPRLRVVIEQMQRAVKRGDRARTFALDREFHETVVSASGQRRLFDVWAGLRDQIELAVAEVGNFYPSLAGRAASHVPLLDAIEAGDLDRALEALEAHIYDAEVFRGVDRTGARSSGGAGG
jgi:DNA-binding GntR family transcriptional regulator